jgi:hypothetical protein
MVGYGECGDGSGGGRSGGVGGGGGIFTFCVWDPISTLSRVRVCFVIFTIRLHNYDLHRDSGVCDAGDTPVQERSIGGKHLFVNVKS